VNLGAKRRASLEDGDAEDDTNDAKQLLKHFKQKMINTQGKRQKLELIIMFFFVAQIVSIWVGILIGCGGVSASAAHEAAAAEQATGSGESTGSGEPAEAGTADASTLGLLFPSTLGVLAAAVLIVVTNLAAMVNLRYAIQLKVEGDEIHSAVVVLAMMAGKAGRSEKLMKIVKGAERDGGPSYPIVFGITCGIILCMVGCFYMWVPGITGVVLFAFGSAANYSLARAYSLGVKVDLHKIQFHYRLMNTKMVSTQPTPLPPLPPAAAPPLVAAATLTESDALPLR
jgi:hypothetical protein